MKITLTDIGEKLSQLRAALDLSQKDIAEAMGVGQGQISKIEKGKGASIDVLLQLFEFYGSGHRVRFVFTDEFEIVMPLATDPTTAAYHTIAVARLGMLEEEITTQFSEVKKLLSSVH